MRLNEFISSLYEARLNVISKQEAIDRHMFGPVYHGTDETRRAQIDKEGFKIGDKETGARNGYLSNTQYAAGLPPPIHHLGFGIYFTTVKSIAKMFNNNSTRGLVEYYLDVPRLETINFASTNTMMRWWIKNGYNMTPRNVGKYQAWIDATQNLTDFLSSRYDAVWFKGKTVRRVLDGDQIAVYDTSRIYRIDPKLSLGWDIGSIVTHNQNIHYSEAHMRQYGMNVEKQPDGWTFITRIVHHQGSNPYKAALLKIPPPGMKGKIVSKRELSRDFQRTDINPRFANQASHYIDVKWAKGGIQHNYIEAELDPVLNKPEP